MDRTRRSRAQGLSMERHLIRKAENMYVAKKHVATGNWGASAPGSPTTHGVQCRRKWSPLLQA